MNKCEVFKKINTIVSDIIGDIDLHPETNLLISGLDSFKFINLVIKIESEFDIEIIDEHLLFNYFSSIKSIYMLLDSFYLQISDSVSK